MTYHISLTVTGFPVTEEQLRDVAQHSGVLEIDETTLNLSSGPNVPELYPCLLSAM